MTEKAARQKKTSGKTIPRRTLKHRLDALARNLWWTWHVPTQHLFASLDPAMWEALERNPIALMRQLPADRWCELACTPAFLDQLEACEAQLHRYMTCPTWFSRTVKGRQKQLRVAYFCAEFALHECLPIYSGGLGVLAGDHLKSASDLGVPLVAVGLLYRHGYYRQRITPEGETRVIYPEYDFKQLPVTDTGRSITLTIGKRRVKAKIWQVSVGRVTLYLLDTDIKANKPADRCITHDLYGGDRQMRIRQEMLLGIGGSMALEKLGITPTVYHLNEGHAAFCNLHRLTQKLRSGMTYDQAVRQVREQSVFTTHTPVPAGHDRFEPALAQRYLKPLAREAGLKTRQILALGREKPENDKESFCMTVLALKLSEHVNGVAKLHGEVSRQMWQSLFDAKKPGDVPIGHITNGIHAQTWLSPLMQPLYDRYLKPQWLGAGPEDNWWRRATRIAPKELWETRGLLRRQLITHVRKQLVAQALRQGGSAADILAAENALDENALLIGFARRFATYKRAPLLFHNLKTLARIIGNEQRPVQFIFAGKAHPADHDGQRFLRAIVAFSRRRQFKGRIVVLENYDMHLGRMLVAGCDVWLNTPLRPNEASGTSGMKPPLHGGINCSILDGWWPEGYNGSNGFVIGGTKTVNSRRQQDAADAKSLYDVLEKKLVPMFYQRDKAGLPRRWIRMMQQSMASVCGNFNTHRMVSQYTQQYYLPAHKAGDESAA